MASNDKPTCRETAVSSKLGLPGTGTGTGTGTYVFQQRGLSLPANGFASSKGEQTWLDVPTHLLTGTLHKATPAAPHFRIRYADSVWL
jgi:hypothetical protein